MARFSVLNTTTGQLQSLSRGQLESVLKKHRREAAQMLKSRQASHVLYGLQHDSACYHIVPCTVYTDARYSACFGGAGATIKPLAVHRK